jgi:hypothetical protein
MEDKVLNLEKDLETLEKNNPSLHINEIKQIKKNAIKLEAEIAKLLNDDNSDTEESINDDDSESSSSFDFDIDKEINKYTNLINELNDESINLKSIEELNLLLGQIIKIEKNIINYQTLKVDLDIKTI